MKRSPLRRKKVSLKRTGFKKKKKTKEKKASERVWELCRQIVWLRDGEKCVHCGGRRGELNEKGSTIVLNAHHWITHDVRSQESRYMFDNLVSLCSSCHLWKWHQGSDMRVLRSIQEHMGQFMDGERYNEIMEMAGKGRVKRVLQDYLDLETEFKEMLAEGGE